MINQSDDQSKNNLEKVFQRADWKDRIFHAIALENKSVIKYKFQKNFEISKVSAKHMRNRCFKLIKHLKVRFQNNLLLCTTNSKYKCLG